MMGTLHKVYHVRIAHIRLIAAGTSVELRTLKELHDTFCVC